MAGSDTDENVGTKRTLEEEESTTANKKQKAENGEAAQEKCKFFEKGQCRFGDRCRQFHFKPEICKFYARGTCKFGSQCKSIHPVPTPLPRPPMFGMPGGPPGFPPFPSYPFSPPPFPAPRPIAKPQKKRAKGPCKFFKKGECKYGDKCWDNHKEAPPVSEEDKKDACIFWKRGECRFGERCKQKHPEGLEGVNRSHARAKPPRMRFEPNMYPTYQGSAYNMDQGNQGSAYNMDPAYPSYPPDSDPYGPPTPDNFSAHFGTPGSHPRGRRSSYSRKSSHNYYR